MKKKIPSRVLYKKYKGKKRRSKGDDASNFRNIGETTKIITMQANKKPLYNY